MKHCDYYYPFDARRGRMYLAGYFMNQDLKCATKLTYC